MQWKKWPLHTQSLFDADKAGSSFLGLNIEHPERLSEFSYDRLIYTNEKPDDEFVSIINREKMVLIR